MIPMSSIPKHLRKLLFVRFTGTYFGRWRRVGPSHGTPPGARPPVHVRRVSPRPGGRRRGRGRTGRGETAGRRGRPARVIVGHVHVWPVVHAHRQKGHRTFGGRRAVAPVAVHAERIARQHRRPVRHKRYKGSAYLGDARPSNDGVGDHDMATRRLRRTTNDDGILL